MCLLTTQLIAVNTVYVSLMLEGQWFIVTIQIVKKVPGFILSVYGWKRVMSLIMTGFVPKSVAKKGSWTENYSRQHKLKDLKKEYVEKLLWRVLTNMARHDAVKENDGPRIIIHWKFDTFEFCDKIIQSTLYFDTDCLQIWQVQHQNS